jgi:acyl-CoA thioesterase-1
VNYLKILIISFFAFPVIAGEDTSSLLIYGDSISAGYGMEKEEQWSRDLEDLFNKDNIKIKIFNSSVSGETTGGGLSRINRVLEELKPSYVLLELGGNDALRGYPPDRIYQNLMTMINACKDRGIEVFLMQIRILPNYGKRYQTQFESVYPKVSAASGVTLIPFMLEEVALNKELMFDDGIHPNEAAQPLIAKFVFESLREYLK